MKWILFVVSTLVVASAKAQAPIAIASSGGITMYAVPNNPPAEGFTSAKIVLKSDSDAKMVTFENINIENAHQVWGSFDRTLEKTSFPPVTGPLYSPEWASFDTHLLIPPDSIGGGVFAMIEGNDMSTDPGLSQLPTTATALTGIGPTKTSLVTDAFFLDSAAQSNEVEFAQVVAAPDRVPTITVGVLGESAPIIGEGGGVFFDAVPFELPELSFCEFSEAEFCWDFESEPEFQVTGDVEWRDTGGVDDGYLKITDAVDGERSKVVIPFDDVNSSLVIGSRTSGFNAVHHIDNLEAAILQDQFSMSVELRIGGGTDRPAEGISFSFVPNTDPATDTTHTDGWAGIGGETNLPEEGTISGVSIAIDEWQTGPAPESSRHLSGPDARDAIGISIRVDGTIVCQTTIPGDGAFGDVITLETGPNTGEALGWGTLTVDTPVTVTPEMADHIAVTWKGQDTGWCVPEPRSSLMLVMSLLSLVLLRRKHQ